MIDILMSNRKECGQTGKIVLYFPIMEWKASHILVKNRSQAEQLLRKIQQGGNFEAIARDYSTCPSKSKGGDLGWFGPGQMVPAFEAAVKRLGAGAVSGVVPTQFGFHIIKLTAKR
jgi:peptidyl-prolyl cis-trans isomerase C